MPDPLAQLAADLEVATDHLMDARDEEAAAENAYLRAYARHYAALAADGKAAATTWDKRSRVVAVEEQCAWNLAVAKRGACWDKVEEIKTRIQAAQSHLKYLGMQDGGQR